MSGDSHDAAPDLVLRPWTEADAEELRAAIDEDLDHIRPWMSWTRDEPAPLRQTRERLRQYVRQFRAGTAFRYAITAPDHPRRILGGISLNTRVGPNAHDLGYWVRKSAAGQGIAGAAVAAAIHHAFAKLGDRRIVAQCDVANTNSASFARHLGFKFAGEVLASHEDGTPRPIFQFEMLVTSYYAMHAERLARRSRHVRVDGPGV